MADKRAGVLIRLKGTNYILLEQAWGKKLPDNIYDIPKGHADDGESLEETAIREVKEEAGISISKDELTLLGEYPYYKGDTIAIFYCEKDFNIEDCECNSYFENWYGQTVPEVVGYKLFDFVKEDLENSHIYVKLRKIFKDIFVNLTVY